MAEAARAPVPRYALYGELPRAAEAGFVHIESLSARSALHDWDIAAHRHDGLQQVLWIGQGGGEARLDSERTAFEAPVLLVVPAGCVHAFRWHPGSEGFVLTLAVAYVAGLGRAPALVAALDTARVVRIEAGETGVSTLFDRLDRELRFQAPGMAEAVAALVTLLMVAVMRLVPQMSGAPEPGAELWQRYRAAVEQGFRRSHAVAEIIAGLAVTRGRLDAVCRRHAGRTAQQVIHDRLTLEAQRGLIYTGLTIAEIAYDLGFVDPAYFTRFFVRETGAPPGEFRRRHRGS